MVPFFIVKIVVKIFFYFGDFGYIMYVIKAKHHGN